MEGIKMKRFIALLCTLAMVLSLTACGSSSSDTTTTDTEEPAAAEESQTAEESQPAEESEAAEETPEESAAATYDTSSWSQVNLQVATSGNENDYSTQCMVYFLDLLKEKSDGKIDYTLYAGGTYCAVTEEYDYVSSGAIDMTLWNQSINATQFPIICFTGSSVGNEEAVELANYMCYENPETSAIFEKYATEGNIKMLGYIPAGYALFCANKEIHSFSDFSDITFGTMLNASLWESLGMNVVSTSPADMYESLSRGTIDSACQALPSALSKMFYEVTDYGLLAGYSSVAYNLIINLDTWNSFSEDQQALITECIDDFTAYSKTYYNECQEKWIDTWESETGNPIAYMSDEDSEAYVKNAYAMNYATYLELAKTLGEEEDFETVVDAHNEYLGFDCRTGE
jgi:TRAP-type C4-dicarboxylate transport system substrate-binding protein